MWDSTQPGHSSGECVLMGGGGEILACDWSKYDHHTIVTAGVDTTVRYAIGPGRAKEEGRKYCYL